MGEDRKLKDKLAHIALALTGIGIFILVGHRLLSKSKSWFLNSTERQKRLKAIEDEITQVVKPKFSK